MGRMFFGFTSIAVVSFALFCPAPFPASGGPIGVSTVWAEEEFRYHDDGILFHFSREKNLVHFNHLIGMLSDLWREHNKFFDAKGKGKNTAGPKVEGLLNDASLAASQGNYEEAFASLKNAYDLLKGSLADMGINADK